jgi:hypothetical protein
LSWPQEEIETRFNFLAIGAKANAAIGNQLFHAMIDRFWWRCVPSALQNTHAANSRQNIAGLAAKSGAVKGQRRNG